MQNYGRFMEHQQLIRIKLEERWSLKKEAFSNKNLNYMTKENHEKG